MDSQRWKLRLIAVPAFALCWVIPVRGGDARSTAKEEVPAECGGIGHLKCPDQQLCVLPSGECKTPDMLGQCKEKPTSCAKEYKPICGCDGKTYTNYCELLRAGQQVSHPGECKKAG